MPLTLPLTPDDQNRLLPLLAEQGRTILERQQWLETAGVAVLLPKIDLNSSAEQFAAQVVRVAQRQGAIAPNVPTLLPIVRQLRQEYAGQAEVVAFLDTLLALPPTEAELPKEPEQNPTIENTITGTSGDVIIANVVIDKESKVAPDITVGKNIIKIGKVVIPIWMFAVAIALPFLLTGGAYLAFVPAKMPNNAAQFNVAVATFGELRNGQVETSATGQRLSEFVAAGLTQEKPVYEAAFGNPIEVWHDGLSPLIKRTAIGMIEGSNEEIRQGAAEKRANEINANMIIYGVVERQSDGREALTLEFYVKPDLLTPVESRFGNERMGDPILIPATFDPNNTGSGDGSIVAETVTNRGRALAWIIRALDRERRGLKSEMIAVIERAEDEANSTETGRLRWPEVGAGKEVIYTLKGEAHLELAYADFTCNEASQNRVALAEAAFQQAIASNARYSLAHIGLGNVAHFRAQCLLTTTLGSVEPTDIEAMRPIVVEAQNFTNDALAHFQRGKALSPDAADSRFVQAVAGISLAVGYRLQATVALWQIQIEPTSQETWLATAQQAVTEGKQLVADAINGLPDDDYYRRIAARAYLIQSNLEDLAGRLFLFRGDERSYEASLEAAVDALTLCEEEANKVFADVYLKETFVPKFCTPQKNDLLCQLGQTALCSGDSP